MTRNEYLRGLHNLIYAANKADDVGAQDWQKPSDVAEHVQPLMDIVEDVLSDEEAFSLFSNCLGNFDAFLLNEALMLRDREAFDCEVTFHTPTGCEAIAVVRVANVRADIREAAVDQLGIARHQFVTFSRI